MDLPEFDEFPSQPTPCGTGRRYQVVRRTVLLAYWIPDPTAAVGASLHGGIVLYALCDGRQVGYWNYSIEPKDLRIVMDAYRRAVTGDYEEDLTGPDGELPMIIPTYNRELVDRIKHQQPPELTLQVDELFTPPPPGSKPRRRLRLVDDDD